MFGIRLITVMNITDIDDKILDRAKVEIQNGTETTEHSTEPNKHPFNRISERYYKSFLDDMNHVRVAPPDITIMVSKQIKLITDYIKHLEKTGHAYLESSSGDVYFDVSSLPNYKGRVDERNVGQSQTSKRDIRDFALWKAAKPDEPVWYYKSEKTNTLVPGRPGWHVQCSAICSAIFGKQLDFHFGGKDLIFPHHYNEQACCCAFHQLDTSKDYHVWSENWLHSGHLVLKDEKMSKSLGNVVGIRKFINETSVNALRLLCVASHYRADVAFDEELLDRMRSLDHKLSAFISYMFDQLTKSSQSSLDSIQEGQHLDLEAEARKVRDDILTGLCDDFDLAKGLNSILELSKIVYNAGSTSLKPKDTVLIWHLLVDWSSMCGLDYGTTRGDLANDQVLINLVKDFRQETRDLVIERIKRKNSLGKCDQEEDDCFLESLLANCDRVRARMDELGFVIRDKKT